jgi:hypothetical protein
MSVTNWFAIGCLLLLAGCASQPTSADFARADGRPADDAQLRLALAKCKGEGATAMAATSQATTPYPETVVANSRNEANIVNACMARNGYLAQ